MIDKEEALRRIREMPPDDFQHLLCKALDDSGIEYTTDGTGIPLSEYLFPHTVTDDDWFGVVRWCNQDIEQMLIKNGIEPTDELVSAVRTECENNHHFTDGMIEAGLAAIEKEICFTCFFKKNAKSLVFLKNNEAARSAGVL